MSIYELSGTCDIRPTVVRTLLTYLELLGHLESGTPFYATYQFKPLASSAEILARFEGERRDFLAKLFSQARKAKIWFEIDVDRAAEAIGATRDRVIRALDYLAEQGLMELKTTGVRHRFRVKRRPDDPRALLQTLYDRLLQRETREIERLRQVAGWVEHDGCQVAALGAPFRRPAGRTVRALLVVSGRRKGQPLAAAARVADRSGRLVAGAGLASATGGRTRRPALVGPLLVRRFVARLDAREVAQSFSVRRPRRRAVSDGAAEGGRGARVGGG